MARQTLIPNQGFCFAVPIQDLDLRDLHEPGYMHPERIQVGDLVTTYYSLTGSKSNPKMPYQVVSVKEEAETRSGFLIKTKAPDGKCLALDGSWWIPVQPALAKKKQEPVETQAVAAVRAFVRWCDRHDWGRVPKKLERQLREVAHE